MNLHFLGTTALAHLAWSNSVAYRLSTIGYFLGSVHPDGTIHPNARLSSNEE
ncbi:MAG: hypothetical protein H0X66_04875 [Verrucomicrobia bacterium]|nr:hypothetical protein [Verrucomicrobiota bacterium]